MELKIMFTTELRTPSGSVTSCFIFLKIFNETSFKVLDLVEALLVVS